MFVSLIQMAAGPDPRLNFLKTRAFMGKALFMRPDIICLPETFLYFGPDTRVHALRPKDERIRFFQSFARRHKVNVILGSVMVKSKGESKLTNTAFVINRKGSIVMDYDKKYLYRVNRRDIAVDERRFTRPGSRPGIFRLDGITMGVGICADVRYPEYFRVLMRSGAQIIFIPACFRAKTGALAWPVLSRARAIENQTYVCACNQTGTVKDKSRFGMSAIISYDGKILKKLGGREGVIGCRLDLAAQKRFRKEFPVLAPPAQF